MPEDIWQKAAYLNSLGMGFPTYENDDMIIPAILRHPEYTLEDARDYAASGCWEVTIQGKALNRNMGAVCALRMVEWALNNGRFALGTPNVETATGLIGDRYGIPTGELEWFDTYPKFFNAVKVQIKHHIDMVSSYVNRSMLSPSPFYSSLMEGTLETGRDFDANGAFTMKQISSLRPSPTQQMRSTLSANLSTRTSAIPCASLMKFCSTTGPVTKTYARRS